MRFSRLYSILFTTVFAVLACTGPAVDDKGGSGSTTPSETDADDKFNSEVDTRVFDLLDLSNSKLSKVNEYRDGGHLYKAAKALLEYYRGRTGVSDPYISLISPVISAKEQNIADWALKESGYKFYTEGFASADGTPYSYLKDSAIDWTLCESSDPEQTFRLNRLEWMQYQGLAYRTSRKEDYAKELIAVWTDWSSKASADWRPSDAAVRIGSLLSAWQYVLQSSSVTPQFASHFLAALVSDANALEESLSKEACADAAVPLSRAAKVLKEFKGASAWEEAGKNAVNQAYKKEWFDVVNLSYAGLEAARRAYEANDYYTSAKEILSYWRSRKNVVNPNVDLTITSVSATEKAYADHALEYRFYVSNYFTDAAKTVPYSYLASDGVSIDWMLRHSGETEQRYQIHRHQWMEYQAKAYCVTKDEKYVRSWMKVFLDWFEQNPCFQGSLNYTVFPDNQSGAVAQRAGWTWRPLDVAARLMTHCNVIDYVIASPNITPEFFMEFLYRISEQADHIANNYSTTSNHLITQAQAVCEAGILYPELAHSARWITSGSGKLNSEVVNQYYNDGWLKDGDFHYHISSIEDFRSSLELAELNGKRSLFPEAYINSIKKMTDVVLNMVYPNYSSVNMTDTRQTTWTASVLKKNFTRYTTIFPDDKALKWMATSHAEGKCPEHLAWNFPDCGYHVLRSGWESSDIMMVLENATTTPSETWHRQWDNGNFELYVKGRKFFPDSGVYSYGGTTATNTARNKYAATSAHNTITLNGKNITSCRGQMLKSAVEGNTDILVMQNPSYSNLSHRKTVFFVDRSFFVIVDEAIGSGTGTVNLNFNLIEGSDSQIVLDLAQNGAHTAFTDNNNILVRTFSDSAISSASKTGFVSYTINTEVERKSYQVNISKTTSDPARFVTVLLPVDSASSHSVSASFDGTYSASKIAVKVSVDGKSYNLSATL